MADAQDVINHLLDQIKQLSFELAVVKAELAEKEDDDEA